MRGLVLAGLMALSHTPVSAATQSYSFTDWQKLAGVTDTINFNDVSADQSFNVNSLNFKGMLFSVDRSGLNETGNRIDAAPFLTDGNPYYSPDESTYLNVDLTDDSFAADGGTLSITFEHARNGFGADFTGFANVGRRQTVRLFSASGNQIEFFEFANRPFDPEGPAEQIFIGFYSAEAIKLISFTYNDNNDPMGGRRSPNDVFGIDNVRLTAAVPEPSSWVLLIGGFGMMGSFIRGLSARKFGDTLLLPSETVGI